MFFTKRSNLLSFNHIFYVSILVAMCTILLVMVSTGVESRDMQSTGQHSAIRRLDCDVFCRKFKQLKTLVGGCHCGLTLFSKKRSMMQPHFFQPSTSKLYNSETVYNPVDDSDEDLLDNNNNNLGSKTNQINMSNRFAGDNLD